MGSRVLFRACATALLVMCGLTGPTACTTATTSQQAELTEPAESTESWIPVEVREGLPAVEDSGFVVITDVAASEPSEPGDRTVVVIGHSATAEATSSAAWEITSQGGQGPWKTVPFEDDGTFETGFYFPADELGGDFVRYDMAIFGGKHIFFDFENGMWTDVEGGTFKPISGWVK